MEKNEKNYNDFVLYEQQGASSFVKVKLDWAPIGKVHLSFVKHSGKNNGCQQLAHIEAALGASSPGGESALFLSEAILNGLIARKRAMAIQRQQETKSKYPEPIFVASGGSPARNGKPCLWRQVTLSPGMKKPYALSALEAEGTVNKMGGFAKKENAEITRIDVAFTEEELIAFAGAIKMGWQAYLISSGACASESRHTASAPEEPAMPAAASAAAPAQPSAAALPSHVYVVYDDGGVVFEAAASPESALAQLQETITLLRKTPSGFARKDNTEYTAAKTAILEQCDEIPAVNLQGTDGTSCQVFVVRLQLH